MSNEIQAQRRYSDTTEVVYSVYEEKWSQDDLEAGDTDKRDTLEGRATRQLGDIDGLLNEYGLDRASASHADAGSRVWFENSTPPMTRERIEKGIDTFYSLHIHTVDGRPAEPDDMLEIAERLDIRFADHQLDRRRHAAAELAFEQADFDGLTVAAMNGWEDDGDDRYTRVVFFENGDNPSMKMQFSLDFHPGTAIPWGDPDFDLPEIGVHDGPVYGYYVDHDERGEFYADVRDVDGKTVYEIGGSGDPNLSIIEDGFIAGRDDLPGLQTYLRDIGIIPDDGEVLEMSAFERIVEDRESGPSPDI